MAKDKQKALELFEKVQKRKNKNAGKNTFTQNGNTTESGKGVSKDYARNSANRNTNRSELGRSKKV